MKNHPKFHVAAILLAILVSCNGQGQREQQNSNLKPSENQLAKVIPTLEKVDTLFAPNAPARIVRRIRKNKDGNLLIAAFTDVVLYDGASFSKLPKPEGVESFDAFDALEDSKGNIWVGIGSGVFRYDGEGVTYFNAEY